MKKCFFCLAALLVMLTACTESGGRNTVQAPPSPPSGIGVRTEKALPTLSPLPREGGQVGRYE